MKKFYLFVLLMSMSSIAGANDALVSYQWLGQHLNDKNLLIVDLRAKNQYEYAHIQGSSHTNIELWRKPKGGIESMLPEKTHLEMLMSTMGARPDSHIVLVASGSSAGELAAAARVYWTLEQMGHAKKSILDGGIIAYAQARLPLERGANPVKPTDYKIFRLKQDQITGDQINNNKNLNLVDVRSRAEYLGIYQGAPDERAGTIPGSLNLPYDWFSKNGGGSVASRENIETVLKTIDIDDSKPTVLFCHTGNRASLSWFVMHEILGNDKVVLYDASTREWAKRKDLPIQQALDIKH